ncbi:M20/M25/M40 family metallo-hydrolase [Opitutus sp. GAS368]|uniref:M20/M25/M40 family metallo-hydrolase n=1 Tax=Opitutus sp. GAS368 TaxID=1882749 RepID=UPI0008794412|nr:M20/M25/M40 family metallo-hydrolase [Opitutus sp. GAS368]SDR72673.1 Acetylornithine deacetylase/Succinyl-diaminopimelate desuccinylase [Opitutus sp. GAS368]
MKITQFFVRLVMSAGFSVAAIASPVQDAVRAYRQGHEQELMAEYREFVALPDVDADQPNVRRNAEFLAAMMRRRGLAAELLEGKTSATNPAVFAEVKVPGATRTIVFYAHYDGQPVNPKEWAEGLDPWKPVFLTAPLTKGGKIVTGWNPGDAINPAWRVNGRASADDKAGVFAILNGYDALVKSGGRPTVNVKFLFEGEEEGGSPHLGEIMELNRAKLQSDLWIICDGSRHVSGRKLVVFGVRGDVNLNLTAYGAKRPLHSGNFGNFAPNPAMRLVSLLASMKDDRGKVLIKGFYDDYVMFSESERIAMKEAAFTDAALLQELGLKEPEVPGRSLLEGFELPTLNINGIASANVGPTATNVIPAVARATLDLRLVLGIDWRLQVERVKAHMAVQGWHVIDHEPTDAERAQFTKLIRVETAGQGYNAQRTQFSLPIARDVIAAVQSTTTEPVMKLPTAGGSLPLSVIVETLGVSVITVPVGNYDNNQHAENENMRVDYLWNGMETFAALMTMP